MGSDNRIKILFLSSDPSNASRLRLGQELRDIRERLQLSKYKNSFVLESRESVRPRDISQALFDFEPQIVHFSGHGTSAGALCFEDITGKIQPVEPGGLADLFEIVADQVTCVVLNACYSKIQAEAVSKHIPYVVGMAKEIGDRAAIAFAIGFYKAVGAKFSIEKAFKAACAEIRLEGISEYSTPVLHQREILEIKTKWTITLQATLDDIDDSKLASILDYLRQVSGDASLTVQRKEAGSVRIFLEGSQEGFERVEELFNTEQLIEILGFPIQALVCENSVNGSISQLIEPPLNNQVAITAEQSTLLAVNSSIGGSQTLNYPTSSYEEQLLYDHLITCRRSESPEQLLERFQLLFIDATSYPDTQILTSLYKIANSHFADEKINLVLNRCCRILINFWWYQPSSRWAIAELVYLLQSAPRGVANQPGNQQLRRLVYQFLQTEEYQSLQRLAYVVEEREDFESPDYARSRHPHRFYQVGAGGEGAQLSLRNLISRYPYLYPYCLGSHSSDNEFETIRHLQAERQSKFERNLSRYMAYLVQQANDRSRFSGDEFKNPTLLSDSQLKRTVKHFIDPVEGTSTYRDLARRFRLYSNQPQPYQVFKDNLYEYLISSIDTAKPTYGKHHFNGWLYSQIQNTLPQSNTQNLDNFLVTRTCYQLMDTLIANPTQFSNHLAFIDLINNVGATVTIGLLLKLLLLCRNLRSNLEKRFASLYKHYEPVTDGINWLIESLENLQIAFSIHFGSVDFPSMKV